MEFKCTLHITGPVSQATQCQVCRETEPTSVQHVCIFLCALACLFVVRQWKGGGVLRGLVGGMDQRSQAWCTAEQLAYVYIPSFLVCGNHILSTHT